MMCTCGHGSDRHYLDYAGPGVCGGILSRCLQKECSCKHFAEATTTVIYSNAWYTFPGTIYYLDNSGQRF